jgi:hypothetical protein
VENGVKVAHILDITIVVFAGMEHNRLLHLFSPGELLLAFDAVH